MKTQMREDVSLAVPAWPKRGITDKRARANVRGHLGGLWIWERWVLEIECRGEEEPGPERWVQQDWDELYNELRAQSQLGRVCDQISSCRASSAGGAEPCSQLLITVKPVCQQIVLKLACKVLCAFLVSNCLEADNLLLLSIILLTQSADFYTGNVKDLNSSNNLPKCQYNAT